MEHGRNLGEMKRYDVPNVEIGLTWQPESDTGDVIRRTDTMLNGGVGQKLGERGDTSESVSQELARQSDRMVGANSAGGNNSITLEARASSHREPRRDDTVPSVQREQTELQREDRKDGRL